MAKWGEGDPRWIVEEREDATNVNNWHWCEKDATKWSKTVLTDLLTNLSFEDPDAGNATTTEISSFEGEATANNRKAKLIFFYEFDITIKWKGKTADGSNASGTFHIPNLSEENDIDEVDVEVSVSSENAAKRKLKEFLRSKAPGIVREQLTKWYKQLREEYAKDLVRPTNSKKPQATTTASSSGVRIHKQSSSSSTGSSASKPAAGSIKCRSLTIEEDFMCAPQDLFASLMDSDRVSAYTQSQAKIDAKVGGTFSLFNGNVTGVIKDLVPYSRISEAWRFSSWPEGHFSEVTMTISEGKNGAHLKLVQTDVPEDDFERTQAGWRAQQFERLKVFFGGMPF